MEASYCLYGKSSVGDCKNPHPYATVQGHPSSNRADWINLTWGLFKLQNAWWYDAASVAVEIEKARTTGGYNGHFKTHSICIIYKISTEIWSIGNTI